jgi:hypothetical protein
MIHGPFNYTARKLTATIELIIDRVINGLLRVYTAHSRDVQAWAMGGDRSMELHRQLSGHKGHS